MTEDEVTKVLGDLHMLHLANEPKNIDDLIRSFNEYKAANAPK